MERTPLFHGVQEGSQETAVTLVGMLVGMAVGRAASSFPVMHVPAVVPTYLGATTARPGTDTTKLGTYLRTRATKTGTLFIASASETAYNWLGKKENRGARFKLTSKNRYFTVQQSDFSRTGDRYNGKRREQKTWGEAQTDTVVQALEAKLTGSWAKVAGGSNDNESELIALRGAVEKLEGACNKGFSDNVLGSWIACTCQLASGLGRELCTMVHPALWMIGGHEAQIVWPIFLTLTALHVIANKNAVRSLRITSLNRERSELLLKAFLETVRPIFEGVLRGPCVPLPS
ncbi:hypothetical protein CYMTET_34496 [Cymbomonas tetramitiformis]|uniref:Protein root UVB sensitive/RUS domain-containing protein n=1 Tax=Cymbomonas tetramitiformis TaxID=36881 RepID=A0AAE0KPW9_9CHLO|nr:hypothetical protein CYMTET_34496 [Cymbomonas tetramitiformis]